MVAKTALSGGRISLIFRDNFIGLGKGEQGGGGKRCERERKDRSTQGEEAGEEGIKEEELWVLKSNIVQRGEREQMAVENVALAALRKERC